MQNIEIISLFCDLKSTFSSLIIKDSFFKVAKAAIKCSVISFLNVVEYKYKAAIKGKTQVKNSTSKLYLSERISYFLPLIIGGPCYVSDVYKIKNKLLSLFHINQCLGFIYGKTIQHFPWKAEFRDNRGNESQFMEQN